MNKYDLEHKLLRGSPLYLGTLPTYKITLGEMADMGFTKVQNIIHILCMSDEQAEDLLQYSIDNPSTFLFIAASFLHEYEAVQNSEISKEGTENLLCVSIPAFLSLFFRKKVVFNQNYGFVIGNTDEDKYLLNDTNYDEFRTILKERNCLLDLEGMDEYDSPSNEMAKKLLEKRKKLREKISKAKKSSADDDSLTMADLISIFAEAEHMPLQAVYDNYDVYQFNNQFNRLKIMDDFHVNIQALLAGAKSEDVKLKHWLSKINQSNN